jgi:hypothetical protein
MIAYAIHSYLEPGKFNRSDGDRERFIRSGACPSTTKKPARASSAARPRLSMTSTSNPGGFAETTRNSRAPGVRVIPPGALPGRAGRRQSCAAATLSRSPPSPCLGGNPGFLNELRTPPPRRARPPRSRADKALTWGKFNPDWLRRKRKTIPPICRVRTNS